MYLINLRVGRTARFQNKGNAVLVLTPSQEEAFVKLLDERRIPITKAEYDFFLFFF